MITKKEKMEFAREFEKTTEMAELRALSNMSLERPPTDKEFARMKELAKKHHGIEVGT